MDIPSAKSLIRRNIPFYLAGALLLLGMKYYYSRGGPDILPCAVICQTLHLCPGPQIGDGRIVCQGLCPAHRYFLHIILASGFSGYPNGAGRLAPPFSKQDNGSLGKQGGKDVRLYIVNIKTVK